MKWSWCGLLVGGGRNLIEKRVVGYRPEASLRGRNPFRSSIKNSILFLAFTHLIPLAENILVFCFIKVELDWCADGRWAHNQATWNQQFEELLSERASKARGESKDSKLNKTIRNLKNEILQWRRHGRSHSKLFISLKRNDWSCWWFKQLISEIKE